MKTIGEYTSGVDAVGMIVSAIDDVFSDIDFKRIAKAMKALDWTWIRTVENPDRYEMYIPDEHEIRDQLKDMLLTVIKYATEANIGDTPENNFYYLDTGGFHVELKVFTDEERKEIYPDEDAPDDFTHSVGLMARFTLEESSTENMIRW